MAFEVILYEPEIPQNAGNIARTCAATGSTLTLVEPLGFSLSDRYLKRSGMDYWQQLQWQTIEELLPYLEKSETPLLLFSTKGKKLYSEVEYTGQEKFIFGPESRGLPMELLSRFSDCIVRIPQLASTRSLNLSNSVAIALYEAIRQTQLLTD